MEWKTKRRREESLALHLRLRNLSPELSPINRYISNVVKFVTFQQSFLHFNVENVFTQHFAYIEM